MHHTKQKLKIPQKYGIIAALVLIAALWGGSAVLGAANPPRIISHQGRLLDSAGLLLGGSGTEYCFKFSIYDNTTVGSGTKLWPSGSPSSMDVVVKNGVFNVGIGDTASGSDVLDFDFQTNNTIFLNVEVATKVGAACGDDETFENLAPRQRIYSSGYTINASTLRGRIASQSADGNEIPVLTSGNLYLGGTNPSITATGSNTLTLQGTLATGALQFFNATNRIDSGGNASLSGNFELGGTVSSNWNPTITNSFSLGTSALRWSNLFAVNASLSGTLEANVASVSQLYIGGTLFSPLTALSSLSATVEITGDGTIDMLKLSESDSGKTYGFVVRDGDLFVRAPSSSATFSTRWNLLSVSSKSLATTIGTPASPSLISTATTTNAFRSYISGRYAYVGDAAGGLRIIDISQPSSPSLKGTLTTTNATEVHVSGRYAYVADGTSGLRIVDVSNPSAPVLKSTLATTNAQHVYVSGRYAYVGDLAGGLRIIDVSNPSAPVLKSTVPLSTLTRGVYVSGRYAYVADGTSGLRVIDISNASAPVLKSTLATTLAMDVYVSGRYAYVADFTGGLRIIDISNPASPVLKSTLATTSARDVFVSGRYAYVADFTGGLRVVDVSNPSSPTLTSSLSTISARGVFVSGRYAYVSEFLVGLHIVDLGGVETHALYAGNISTNDITVYENIDVGNNLYVRNGLNVGQGGLLVNGLFGLNASFSANTASVSRADLFRIAHPLGRLAGDALRLDIAANTTADFFTGNFAKFTTAGTPRFIIESSGAVLASGAAQFGAGGAPSSVSYSRFGTATTGHSLSSADDLLISGFLEVDDDFFADADASVSGNLEVVGMSILGTNQTVGYGATARGTLSVYGSSAQVPLVIGRGDNMTVNLTDWLDNSGGKMAFMDISGSMTLASSSSGPAPTGGSLNVRSLSGFKGIIVKDASNQTGTLFEGQNSAGSVVFNVTAAGNASLSGNFELSGFVSSNLTPTVTNTYSLGTSSLRWSNLFAVNASLSSNLEVNGYASVSALYIGGSVFSPSGASSLSATVEITGDGTVDMLKLSESDSLRTYGFQVRDGDLFVRAPSSSAAFGTRWNVLSVASNSLATTIGTPASPSFAGVYNTVSGAVGVYVSGKYAYIADNTSGLQIVDISRPASPALEGSLDTSGGTARSIYVAGRYAYLADGAPGLQVIDVSNPSTPTLVGTFDTTDARGVYVSGRYAYVADTTAGLQVIDVSNPSTPTLVGTFDTTDARGVFVSGKYAYVADQSPGLHIIDVSNPSRPILVGTYDTAGTALAVYVSGKYAYVADQSTGLQIVDVSNPSAPTLVGSIDTTSALGVFVSGKYAYVGDATSGLRIIDISNPSVPTLVSTLDTSGNSFNTFVSGRYVYMADLTPGLQIFDVGGVETHALYAGNISTNDITVYESIDVGNSLYVRNGLNVGTGGILTNGSFGLSASFSSNTASVSRAELLRVVHSKGYLSGDALLMDLAAATTQEFFTGNFAKFTTAGTPRFIIESSGAVLASGAAQFGAAGAPSSVSYSRFGTTATGHALANPYDLLLSGVLEVDGQTFFDSGASISGNFEPSADNSYDLGSSAFRWRDIYISSGSVHLGVSGNEAVIDYGSGSFQGLLLKPNGTTTTAFFADGGNVGFGTNAPSNAKFEVTSGTDTATNLLYLNTGVHGGTIFQIGGTGNNESTLDMQVYRAGFFVSRMSVGSDGNLALQPTSGNVGIGDSTPTTTLDVSGSASLSGNFELSGFVSSNLTPTVTNTYSLGTSSLRWSNLFGVNASLSNNLEVLGYASVSQLFVNGSAVVAAGWTDDGTVVRLSTITDNVGIGSASPVTTLGIEGNFRLDGRMALGPNVGINLPSGSFDETTNARLIVSERLTAASSYSYGIINQLSAPQGVNGGAVYGIYNDITTGFADEASVYGVYSHIRKNSGTVAGDGDFFAVYGEVTNSATGGVEDLYGGNFYTNHQGTGTVSNIFGVSGTAIVTNSVSGAVTRMIGGNFIAQTNGSRVSSESAGIFTVGAVSTGTVLTGHGIRINAASNPDKFGSLYGLFIANQNGAATKSFNIFSAGATSRNYFEGNASVGGNFELTGTVSSNLTPTVTNTYSLGTSSLRWSNLFAVNASLSSNLEVNGYASLSQLFVNGSAVVAAGWTDDGTTVRLTTSTDNVGIGTATIDSGIKLEVVGVASISSSLRIGSVGAASETFEVSGTGSISGNFRVQGNITSPQSGFSNTEKFGSGATLTGANSLAVGTNASASVNAVAIGYGAIAGGGGGSYSSLVAIGLNALASAGHNTVVIGASAAAHGAQNLTIGVQALTRADGAHAIGYGAQAFNSGALAVGYAAKAGHFTLGGEASSFGYTASAGVNSTALGARAVAGQSGTFSSTAIGRGSYASESGSFVAGSNLAGISSVYFGYGIRNATPLAYSINGTSGLGTNIAGASMTLAGGRGTGSGAGGSLIFQTAAAGSTGTSQNSLTTRLTIDSTGLALFAGNATVSGNFELSGFVSSNLTPTVTDTYDLGTTALRWRDLYLASGSLHIGTSGDEAVIDYNVNDDYLAFKPDGSTTTMRFFDSGAVSISGSFEVGTSKFNVNLISDSVGIGTSNSSISGGFSGLVIQKSLAAVSIISTNANGRRYDIQSAVSGGSGIFNISDITGGTNVFTINSDGNIGVGNNIAPDEKLEVLGNAEFRGNVIASISGNVDLILNSLTSEDTKFTVRSVGASGRLDILGSASQTYLTILQGGNVGIGTTSVLAKLQVKSLMSDTAGAVTPLLYLNPGGTVNTANNFEFSGVTTSTGRAGARMVMYGDNAGNASTLKWDLFTASSGLTSSMSFSAGGAFFSNIGYPGGGDGNAFVFRSVSVNSGSGVDNVLAVRDYNNNVNLFTVARSGNVGVGDSTPDAKLEIIASSSLNLLSLSSTAAADGDLFKVDVSGNASLSGNFELSGFVSSNLTPRVTNTYSLGTSTLRWSNLFGVSASLSSTLEANVASVSELYIGGTLFSGSSTSSLSASIEITGDGSADMLKLTESDSLKSYGFQVRDGDFFVRTPSSSAEFSTRWNLLSVASNSLAMTLGTPASPSLAGLYSPSGVVYAIRTSGRYVYALGSTRLSIIDVSRPASPSLVGSTTALTAQGEYDSFDIAGKYVYGQKANSFRIVDVSNPRLPVLAGSLNISGASQIYSIAVSGKYAYVGFLPSSGENFAVIDISNPAKPVRVGGATLFGGGGAGVLSVTVSGRYAYVTDDLATGFGVVDISNPSSPLSVGSVGSGLGFESYVSGRYAYVANDGSMKVIDIANPTSPTVVATFTPPGASTLIDVFVSGKYAYLAASGYGLFVVDISNPTSPRHAGKFLYGASGIHPDVVVSGRYAYFTDSNDLQIVDLGGVEAHALFAGNISTSDITVYENADIGNNLNVRNGLNVGTGGLMVNGTFGLSASLSSSTSRRMTAELVRVAHSKGYLSGDALRLDLAASTSQEFFTGNFAKFTLEGTPRFLVESSGAVLASGAAQFGAGGAPSSVSYSRFGSSATSHSLSAASDLLLSSILEVNGQTFLDSNASVSGNFEIVGTASISGTTTLAGLTYTWPSSHGTNLYLKNDGSGNLTWATAGSGAGVASDGLDFDEFRDSMLLDANLTVASAGFTVNWEPFFTSSIVPAVDDTYDLGTPTRRWRDVYVGPSSLHIGTAGNSTTISFNTTTGALSFADRAVFAEGASFSQGQNIEISGIASLSIARISEQINVGNLNQPISSYSRFGVATTNRGLSAPQDVMISGMFEVDGRSFFDGPASFSSGLELAGNASISGTTTLRGRTYTWPSNQGGANNVLANSNGTLSWASVSGGGWTDGGTTVQLTTSTDNVGIGTTAATVKLEVVGVASVSGNIIINNSTGNIGIGTTTPGSRISVMGTAGATGLQPLFEVASASGQGGLAVNGRGNLTIGYRNQNLTYNRMDDVTNVLSGHGLDSTGDLLIGDDLEVNGQTYLDGAASLSDNLEVAGVIKVQATGTVTAPQFTSENDADTGMYFPTSNDGTIAFTSDGTETMRIQQTNGNVGIGTTSITAKLRIAGTTGTDLAPLFTLASLSATNVFSVNSEGTMTAGGNVNSNLTYHRFATTNALTTHSSDLSSGNDLLIDGSLEVNDLAFFDAFASVAGGLEITTGVVKVPTTGTVTVPQLTSEGDVDTGLFFPTSTDGTIAFTADGTETMRILSTGNVGIGDTTPTARLVVEGAGGNPILIVSSASGGSYLYMNKTGAVQIGGQVANSTTIRYNTIDTNNGSAVATRTEVNNTDDLWIQGALEVDDILQVNNHASVSGHIDLGTGSNKFIGGSGTTLEPIANPQFTFDTDRDTGMANRVATDPNKLFFSTGGTGRMVIDAEGDVVLGTVVSGEIGTARLTVEGRSAVAPIVNFASSSGLSVFYINSKGAIQVGTGNNTNETRAYGSFDSNASSGAADRSEVNDLVDLYMEGALEVDSILDVGGAASIGGAFEIAAGYLKIPDGTAALPGLRFQSSPTAGLYQVTTNVLGITTGGTERIRFDSDGNIEMGQSNATGGNLGIGTSAPLGRLGIVGLAGSNQIISIASASAVELFTIEKTGNAYFTNATGNVGVGVAADGTLDSFLTIQADDTTLNAEKLLNIENSSGTDYWTFYDNGASFSNTLEFSAGVLKMTDGTVALPAYTFSADTDVGLYRITTNILGITTGGTEALRVDGSSNVGITNGRLQVSGTTFVTYNRLGTTTTGHSLDASNDLLISDDLEVDGDIFADAALTVVGAINASTFSGTTISVTNISATSASISGSFEATGTFHAGSGTAGAPSYAFDAATNTGMYLSGASQVGFSAGGTLIGRFDSGGLTVDVGDINVAGVYEVGGTPGIARNCAANEFLGDMTTVGGIVTAGTCETDDVDYAERFYEGEDGIEAGDIVIADPKGRIDIGIPDAEFNQAVVKSSVSYQSSVVGVISTNPGLVIGSKGTEEHPAVEVALAGRVPVKVTTANGAINVGDRIVASDIAGVGMKATMPGMAVGIALEPTNLVASGSIQTVMMFIQTGYWAPSVEDAIAGADLQLESQYPGLFAMLVAQFKQVLNIDFAQGLVQTIKGVFTEVQTDKLCVGQTCVTEEQLQDLLDAQGIVGSTPAPSESPEPETSPEGPPPTGGETSPTPEVSPESTPEPEPEPTTESTPEPEPAP